MKNLKILLVSALVAICGSISPMGIPEEGDAGSGIEQLQYVTLEDTQNFDIESVNSTTEQNVEYAEDHNTDNPGCMTRVLQAAKKHKHLIHTVVTGASSIASVWTLGQDNPMTSMIFLNGFGYNVARYLPKTSNRQIIRFVAPALLTVALYCVDVALGSQNIDTNWAFGLIGASIAQVSWTKRLHKPKKTPPADLEDVVVE